MTLQSQVLKICVYVQSLIYRQVMTPISEKHQFTSYPAAKHLKHNKLSASKICAESQRRGVSSLVLPPPQPPPVTVFMQVFLKESTFLYRFYKYIHAIQLQLFIIRTTTVIGERKSVSACILLPFYKTDLQFPDELSSY